MEASAIAFPILSISLELIGLWSLKFAPWKAKERPGKNDSILAGKLLPPKSPTGPGCMPGIAKKANGFSEFLMQTHELLIETDAPFLAPEPKRGATNEPSFIKYTAKKLAEIKDISYEDLIVYTSNNFNKLFSIN